MKYLKLYESFDARSTIKESMMVGNDLSTDRRFKNFFQELEYDYDYNFKLEKKFSVGFGEINQPVAQTIRNHFELRMKRDDEYHHFMTIVHFDKTDRTGENFIDIDFFIGENEDDGEYPEGSLDEISRRVDVKGGIDLQKVFTAIKELLDINLPK